MTTATHYIKKQDGSIFGPAPLAELRRWAMDGRIAPDDQISSDQMTWQPAPGIPELEMHYLIRFTETETYGPINLHALTDLILDNSVTVDDAVVDVRDRSESRAGQVLLTALMAERSAVHEHYRETIDRLEQSIAQERARVAELQRRAAQAPAPGVPERAGRDIKIKELEQKVQQLTEERDRLKHQPRPAADDGRARADLEAAVQEQARLRQTMESEKQQWQKRLDEQSAELKKRADSLAEKVQQIDALKEELRTVNRQESGAATREAESAAREKEWQAEIDRLKRVLQEREQKESETAAAGEQDKARKKEQNLSHRIEQLEKERRELMAEMVRLKESSGREQAAGTGPAQPHPVVRAALSQMKAQALSGHRVASAPRPISVSRPPPSRSVLPQRPRPNLRPGARRP